MIFVISDTHFGHANIIKYCDRPFKDTEEMDWEMVRRWNLVVGPNDHVWHLGDVYMGCKPDYINHLLGQLRGKKRLVLGNHDNAKDQILQRHFEKMVLWRDFHGEGLLLSHIPIAPSSIIRGRLNVHGHIHNQDAPGELYRNVSVERINYTPIALERIR